VLDPIRRVERKAWRAAGFASGQRAIPEETAVAITYKGSSYAVMMATRQDLEDFAYGFSLTEGIITSPDEVESLEIVEEPIGIELRMRLAEPHATTFRERRRFLAGPTGCGLWASNRWARQCACQTWWLTPATPRRRTLRWRWTRLMEGRRSIRPPAQRTQRRIIVAATD
jgi:formate dehydrogenase assembly factor FdhD